jgi:ribosomal protein S18 acetylase RimI-like enzyme
MSYQYKYRNYSIALYEALLEDAFYITMEQSIDDITFCKEAMLRYMDYSMVEAEKYGELFMPSDHQWGVSVWSMPIDRELEAQKYKEKRSFIVDHMSHPSLEKYDEIVGHMTENGAALIDKHDWYLSIVGVLPEYQGKGFGVELVNNMLVKTDRLKVRTSLETFTARKMLFTNAMATRLTIQFTSPPLNQSTGLW